MTEPRSAEEVGKIIQTRIEELDLSLAEIQRRGGPSGRTVRAYVGGAAVKDIDNRRTLSLALDWSPDSIRRIQEGDEPVVRPRTAEDSEDVIAMAERATLIINELARRAAKQ